MDLHLIKVLVRGLDARLEQVRSDGVAQLAPVKLAGLALSA